ncbi:DUF1460 domain-containing protein [Kalamiella sp. sgz302252]|uniref:DUF1460 domain-containing protein n=1 Tax=Pantoea sp. sgz302252 TaxID=3341827 RepID=UPI0036D41E36
MKKHFLSVTLFLFLASCTGKPQDINVKIDSASQQKLASILKNQVIPSAGEPDGERINRISAAFINTPYIANTLIGSQDKPEKLVVNLTGVDCFTFIDYVNALRHATDKNTFYSNLINTRYKEGKVDFFNRRHFFTDWAEQAPQNARDVTAQISPSYKVKVKFLNKKADGSEYLPGLGVQQREITYIPGKSVDQQVIDNLKTGDFIGIYTDLPGLDVTHVGLFIAGDSGPLLRNASSLKANMKVVDSPFVDYVKNKPGIIVLRPVQ